MVNITKNPKNKRLLINFFIVVLLVSGTLVAIKFAKGYRPNLQKGTLQGTGLLSATSYPKAARVNINDKLTTVTDDKLYLTPASYTVKIEKDGFHPWTKNILIKPELVTSADARLFPIITATSPLTFYQVKNATVNPDGTRIAYVLTDAPQDTANGLYVHSETSTPLSSPNIQIATNNAKDFSQALLVWSPDGSQILAVFTEKNKISSAYLLSTRSLNDKNSPDVTVRLPLIINQWQDQYSKINIQTLTLYPKYLSDLLKTSSDVYFSPDKEKVFYTPQANASLPANEIGQTLPNINSTPETRNLLKNRTYLFDLKEGTNYQLDFATQSATIKKQLIVEASATPSAGLADLIQLKAQDESYLTGNLNWYSNSRQLIVTNSDGVNMVDYDGLNPINITSVQSLNGFVAPSADGSKLILLTNINQKPTTYNLIAFDLK